MDAGRGRGRALGGAALKGVQEQADPLVEAPSPGRGLGAGLILDRFHLAVHRADLDLTLAHALHTPILRLFRRCTVAAPPKYR